jgi:DNA mismatch repair protein MutL
MPPDPAARAAPRDGGQLPLSRATSYGDPLARFGAGIAADRHRHEDDATGEPFFKMEGGAPETDGPSSTSSLPSSSPSFSRSPSDDRWEESPPAELPLAQPLPLEPPGTTPYFQTLAYIGQLDRTYLVCEARGELVLVDQHAAHERIAFERLRAAHGRREIRRQRLLFPIPIELDDPLAVAAVDDAALGGLGFEAERTGERTVVLRAVPEVLKDADPKPLLAEVLGQLAAGETTASFSAAPTARFERILATMACHSVVRAGDVLSRPQAQALLLDLDRVDLRMHCPHGRPVLLRLALTEIERRFGRT